MSKEEFEKIIKFINSLIDSDINDENIIKNISKEIFGGNINLEKNSSLGKNKSYIKTENGWKELGVKNKKTTTEQINKNLKKFVKENNDFKEIGVNIIGDSDNISFVEKSLSDMVDIYTIFSYTFEMCVKLKLFNGNQNDVETLYKISLESLRACNEKRTLSIKKKDISKIMYYTNLLSEEIMYDDNYWNNVFCTHYRNLCLQFYKDFTKYAI